jgi:oxygen-independent coproporphyrinogen-3 oxidase
MIPEYLLKKYDREVPRYTSYPTVPFWKEMPDKGNYIADFKTNFNHYNAAYGISLYIHLPFCESLCTYCGCNKVITANHRVEEEYLNAILNEWYQYRRLMPATPIIRQLHLGGGTPTFFSADNLRRLLNCIFDIADIHPEREFSIEGHPNNTTKAHLKMLHLFGFRRISFGVQDHDPEVQRIINRIQPYENVKKTTVWARESGFSSVNYDLIYGLPRQTEKSIEKTVLDTIALRPDRIAFYSYAHIPWKARSQRLYDENDLPSPEQKLKFYTLSRELFLASGYKDIGMDHFALPSDDLYKAYKDGRLQRNFMGYTAAHTRFLLGLGVSAISDTGTAYVQNDKKLSNYYGRLNDSELPVLKGYFLNQTDVSFRQYILDISCRGKTRLHPGHKDLLEKNVLPELKEMEADGLVIIQNKEIKVTETGRMFLRNICHAFDLKGKLYKNRDDKPKFSKSI